MLAGLLALWIDGVDRSDWPSIFLMVAVVYLGLCLFTWGRPAVVMDQLFIGRDSDGYSPALRRRGIRAVVLTVLLIVVGIFVVVSLGPPDP